MRKSIRFLLFILVCSVSGFAQKTTLDRINAFTTKTGAVPTISKATGSISFLKFPGNRSLKLAGTTPKEKAFSFLKDHAELFPTGPGKNAFLLKESKQDHYGLSHVDLRQHVEGVPVFDGVLKFHFNKNNELSSMNSNVIEVGKPNTLPTVSREAAEAVALKMMGHMRSDDPKAVLKVLKNTLYIFQKGLVQGYKGPVHLVYEVEVGNGFDIREFLYIDAHSQELVEQFTGVHGIDRNYMN